MAALATLPVRAVLTTGHGIDPASIEAPANVQVVKAAPHSAVLREAALAITHAGHGVTIKSLAAGVPLVCLPMGRDQLDIAARVVHAGAGVRLEPTAAPAEISSAAEQVLGETSYREAAERIAMAIQQETATDRAVEEIEAVLASTPRQDLVRRSARCRAPELRPAGWRSHSGPVSGGEAALRGEEAPCAGEECERGARRRGGPRVEREVGVAAASLHDR